MKLTKIKNQKLPGRRLGWLSCRDQPVKIFRLLSWWRIWGSGGFTQGHLVSGSSPFPVGITVRWSEYLYLHNTETSTMYFYFAWRSCLYLHRYFLKGMMQLCIFALQISVKFYQVKYKWETMVWQGSARLLNSHHCIPICTNTDGDIQI